MNVFICAYERLHGVGRRPQPGTPAGVSDRLALGPSLAIYSMPVCGALLCGRVVGLAPGGHAEVNAFFVGPLGVSVNASIEWVGGRSLVLPGGVAALLLVGPVVRWEGREGT